MTETLRIFETVMRFSEGSDHQDDRTLVVVKRNDET